MHVYLQSTCMSCIFPRVNAHVPHDKGCASCGGEVLPWIHLSGVAMDTSIDHLSHYPTWLT